MPHVFDLSSCATIHTTRISSCSCNVAPHTPPCGRQEAAPGAPPPPSAPPTPPLPILSIKSLDASTRAADAAARSSSVRSVAVVSVAFTVAIGSKNETCCMCGWVVDVMVVWLVLGVFAVSVRLVCGRVESVKHLRLGSACCQLDLPESLAQLTDLMIGSQDRLTNLIFNQPL